MTAKNSIFISYRRIDSQDIAGRIYDRLASHFGREAVFRDVHSIPLGLDFRTHIEQQLASCQVLVAVIGPKWLEVLQERLDAPIDWVRTELATALKRDIPLIPLLVGGGEMPTEQDLPQELQLLASRNGTQARPDPDFHNDMDRLIRQLEGIVSPVSPKNASKSLSIVEQLELDDLQQQLEQLQLEYKACQGEARLTGDPDRKIKLQKKGQAILENISKIDSRIKELQAGIGA